MSAQRILALDPEPYPVPDSWLSGNHYIREYVRRLEAVADAGKALHDATGPTDFPTLQARADFRNAWLRLQGEVE